jgi:hypothetical protein
MPSNANTDAEGFLESFVKTLKFLNKEEKEKAFKRGKELEPIFGQIAKYPMGISSLDDLPRQEFRGAIQRYLIGFCDDSIYHSCLSVEIALLILLETHLSKQEKDLIHAGINTKTEKPISFTFGAILEKCRQKNLIIDKKIIEKIEALIEKRNMYIHASNFLSGLIVTLKENSVPEIDKILRDFETLEKQPLVGRIAKMNYTRLPQLRGYLIQQKELFEKMPTFEWCSKDKHRENAEHGVKQFIGKLEDMKKSRVDTTSLYNKLISAANLRSSVKDIIGESYFKDESFDILSKSFEILTDLGLF